MALQTLRVGGLFLDPMNYLNGSFSSTLIMDATAEKVAFIFQCPKSGTLDKVEFRCGAVTFNAASVLRVSFQNLSSGDPDGTQDQYRDMTTLSANAWNVPGLMTSDGTNTGTKRSVTKGDIIAVVFEFQTFTALDSVIISACAATGTAWFANTIYTDLYTASWAKQASIIAIMALKYDDGLYEPVVGGVPILAFNNVLFNSGSTPDERGLIFQVPYPCRVTGFAIKVETDAAADVVLYDSNGTSVLATASLDSTIRQGVNGTNTFGLFPASATLLANTAYRLVVKPTTVSDVRLYDYDATSAAVLGGFDAGANCHYTSRVNAGAWTEVTTKRPAIAFIVSAADDALSLPSGYVVPTEAQVEAGVQYGAAGTEFEGTLAAGGGSHPLIFRRR